MPVKFHLRVGRRIVHRAKCLPSTGHHVGSGCSDSKFISATGHNSIAERITVTYRTSFSEHVTGSVRMFECFDFRMQLVKNCDDRYASFVENKATIYQRDKPFFLTTTEFFVEHFESIMEVALFSCTFSSSNICTFCLQRCENNRFLFLIFNNFCFDASLFE